MVQTYWKAKTRDFQAKYDFGQFFKSVDSFSAKTQKEDVILENMNEEIRNASSYRTDMISLITSKTSKILWVLLIVLSITLILSFSVVEFASQLFATLAITMLSAAIAIVTVIIYDMDYPFQAGFWVISPDTYFELEEFVKAH